jgi:hypothetical protein
VQIRLRGGEGYGILPTWRSRTCRRHSTAYRSTRQVAQFAMFFRRIASFRGPVRFFSFAIGYDTSDIGIRGVVGPGRATRSAQYSLHRRGPPDYGRKASAYVDLGAGPGRVFPGLCLRRSGAIVPERDRSKPSRRTCGGPGRGSCGRPPPPGSLLQERAPFRTRSASGCPRGTIKYGTTADIVPDHPLKVRSART